LIVAIEGSGLLEGLFELLRLFVSQVKALLSFLQNFLALLVFAKMGRLALCVVVVSDLDVLLGSFDSSDFVAYR
jgi:hypothetical protein